MPAPLSIRRTVVGLAVAAALVCPVMAAPPEAASELSVSRAWLFMAALAGTVATLLRAWRWRYALRTDTLRLSSAFDAIIAAGVGNWFLPARVGDVWRVLITSNITGLPKTGIATTLGVEKVLDLAALLAVAAMLAGASGTSLAARVAGNRGTLAVVLLLVFVPVTIAMLGRRCLGLLPDRTRTMLVRARQGVWESAELLRSPRRLAVFGLITALVWSAEALAVLFVSWSLSLAVPVPLLMLAVSIMGIAVSMPFTPGAVAVSQVVVASVMVPAGITVLAATKFVLITQGVGLVVVLVWGGFAVLRSPWTPLAKTRWHEILQRFWRAHLS